MRKTISKTIFVVTLLIILLFSNISISVPVVRAEIQYNDIIFEAENSEFVGRIVNDENCSNGQYIQIVDNNYIENTHILFSFNIVNPGFYNILIKSYGSEAEKQNIVEIDGEVIQKYLISYPDIFTETTYVEEFFFDKGVHTFEILPLHGWISVDYLKVSPTKLMDYENMFDITHKLSNPNASNNAKELFAFLKSSYGEYIIAGQHTEYGMTDPDFQKIINQTGKTPAILGLDLMNYSPFFDRYGEPWELNQRTAINSAIEFASIGGIVTFCWHWVAPEQFLKKGENGDYLDAWQGFRTQYVDMDLNTIKSDKSSQEYLVLLNDIDLVAERLKILFEKDIPILFRPLHEASGGWFWWGSSGAEAYIELWKLMYDRMTNYHGLNNLIWVWNGQSKDWYPGDKYVDIVGEDIYTAPKDYDEHAEQFALTTSYPDTPKITALTENGTLFDIDEAIKSNTMWAWFLNWHGIHTIPGAELSEEYSTLEMWQTVYNHDKVLTLDEIPFHSHTDNNNDVICDYCRADISPQIDPFIDNIKMILICGIVFIVVFIIITIVIALIKRKKHQNNISKI